MLGNTLSLLKSVCNLFLGDFKESDNYLKEIIAEFRQARYRNQYWHIIKPPYGKQNIPLLFLWSPRQSSIVEI